MPNKKMTKLRKTRLWPSILFFLFAVFLGALLLALEFSLYTAYVTESKYMQSLAKSQAIANSVDLKLLMGEDSDAALQQASLELNDTRALAIFDRDDRPLASVGPITVDISQKVSIELGDTQEIYWDQENVRTVIELQNKFREKDEEGRSRLGAIDLFLSIVVNQADSLKTIEADWETGSITDSVFNWVYWQSVPLSNIDGRLLIREHLKIQKDDLIFGFGITAVSAFMFLIVLSVQFGNVVSKVHAHRRMEKLLLMDPITGGNNRMAFMQKVSSILEKRRLSLKTYVVADLSILNYHSFCILHGTEAGEELLTDFEHALRVLLGPSELCGHIGGPDFALLLVARSGEKGKEAAVERVKTLIGSIPEIMADKGCDRDFCRLNIQAGLCFSEPSDRRKRAEERADAPELYVNAGIAKAAIAAEEGEVVACFSQKMREEQLWQHKVEHTMQEALDNEEFQVYIQPKYNPTTGKLSGAEALVRWLSPTDGMIPPGRFIPLFEKNGFVTKLDDYMISHIARLQSRWIAEGRKVVPISVNVSRAHFIEPNLAEHIRDLVDVYGVPHQYIEIELTESAFFDDKKTLLNTVHKLQEYGFDVSMDDFGSGYSSLNSLKDLPLDILKLDADFFRGDGFDTRGEIVVSKAISLAKQLNMRIVAEGVEKKEQVDFLAQQDCDMIQGYYYAKPMPADEYAQRLEADAIAVELPPQPLPVRVR